MTARFIVGGVGESVFTLRTGSVGSAGLHGETQADGISNLSLKDGYIKKRNARRQDNG